LKSDFKNIDLACRQLAQEQERRSEAICQSKHEIENIKRIIDEICVDLDENDRWRIRLEECLGIERYNIQQAHSNSKPGRGKRKNR